MNFSEVFPYIAVSALVTYLVRMVPMVLFRKKINNRFLLSFFHYLPYAVLTAMTIPAIFYATGSAATAAAGFAAAAVLAFFDRGLFEVAACSCAAVFAAELLRYFLTRA